MSGFGKRAFLLTLSKFANYGLMVVSPIILVRLLSVESFGRYREFLVYSVILQSFASFSINDSLLYFIPRHPRSPWQIVSRTAVLVTIASIAVVTGFFIIDWLSGGWLVSQYRLPLAIYTLLFVNLDFWEAFLLAQQQTLSMFLYTIGRLIARVLVVVAVAMATADVTVIVWSLVGLEAVRFALSALVWRNLGRARSESTLEPTWRDQLHFCVPAGIAVVLTMMNRNIGNLAVTKMVGVAALAHYTIGTYGEPIVVALRNSISTLLLPEMVRRGVQASETPLLLWQRATVANCILLFPVAVLAAVFAEPLVVTVFGANYRPAIPVLQIYSLIMVRECFDFSPPLRALNKTRPLVQSNAAATIANVAAVFVAIPILGLAGAMLARVLSSIVDAGFLCVSTCVNYRVKLRHLLPWLAVVKTAAASALAAIVLAGSFWTEHLGFAGVFVGSAVYGAVFAILLYFSGVTEARVMFNKLRSAAGFPPSRVGV